MTDFDSEEWCDRMRKAKDGKEIGSLLDELPYRPTSSANKEDQEFPSTEPE